MLCFVTALAKTNITNVVTEVNERKLTVGGSRRTSNGGKAVISDI